MVEQLPRSLTPEPVPAEPLPWLDEPAFVRPLGPGAEHRLRGRRAIARMRILGDRPQAAERVFQVELRSSGQVFLARVVGWGTTHHEGWILLEVYGARDA
jgi:hypothetical protein